MSSTAANGALPIGTLIVPASSTCPRSFGNLTSSFLYGA
jgi:hypothetical protein